MEIINDLGILINDSFANMSMNFFEVISSLSI
jgi:hypothetical protein